MVQRTQRASHTRAALERAPVVLLTGPRQCGKTTFAREIVPAQSSNYFDLEDPTHSARLREPKSALDSLRGLVVIDEVQRQPELFPLLRVLVDREDGPARFLILGSASGDLLRQSSESLAGRIERHSITGFTLDEVGVGRTADLWRRGGFPRSFLARSETESLQWRREYVLSLVERDLPQWGVRVPAAALFRFWNTLAHYHGQPWNAAAAARSMQGSPNTMRRYLDLFSDALVVRQLQPWYANLAKRQVHAPKVYIRDSGLLHQLLGVSDMKQLEGHPRRGASWEGFIIEQVIAGEPHDDAWFWATHQQAEIDLVLRRGDKLYGVECKYSDAPRVTPSIRTALEALPLERVAIVYPGSMRFPLGDRVEAVPVATLANPGGLFP